MTIETNVEYGPVVFLLTNVVDSNYHFDNFCFILEGKGND